MNLQKIAEALRTIADAMDEPFSSRNTVTRSPTPDSSSGTTVQPAAQPTAQPAAQPAAPTDILDAQVFTTSMQTMAREVGSGVIHQLMPDVYTRYADGIQKYSAIKPENRQAVIDYVRDRINAMKQGQG